MIRMHVVTIGQEFTPEDETSNQTEAAEVTLVCNDHKHFKEDQEVIEAENKIVKKIFKTVLVLLLQLQSDLNFHSLARKRRKYIFLWRWAPSPSQLNPKRKGTKVNQTFITRSIFT